MNATMIWECITPSIAAEMLKGVAKQRPARASHVRRLAAAMTAGEWEQGTGKVIEITVSGNVRDGRHRLLAVIESGVPLWTWVARGVPDLSGSLERSSESVQLRWTLSDILSSNGEVNCSTLASVLFRSLWLGRGAPACVNAPGNGVRDCLREFSGSRALYTEATRFAVRGNDDWLVPASMVGSLFVAFARAASVEEATTFFDDFRTGANLPQGDPVLLLRESFVKAKEDTTRKRTTTVKYAWIIKAWNARRAGEKMRLMRWSPTESFPTIN